MSFSSKGFIAQGVHCVSSVVFVWLFLIIRTFVLSMNAVLIGAPVSPSRTLRATHPLSVSLLEGQLPDPP